MRERPIYPNMSTNVMIRYVISITAGPTKTKNKNRMPHTTRTVRRNYCFDDGLPIDQIAHELWTLNLES